MTGATFGEVKGILRLEGLAVLILALYAYNHLHFSWQTFALFFLLPDLSLLGYCLNPRIGALSYNSAHSYLGALLCLFLGTWLALPAVLASGLIWCAHLGFDRALGYGLKYQTGFRFTHLGFIGQITKHDPSTPLKHADCSEQTL